MTGLITDTLNKVRTLLDRLTADRATKLDKLDGVDTVLSRLTADRAVGIDTLVSRLTATRAAKMDSILGSVVKSVQTGACGTPYRYSVISPVNLSKTILIGQYCHYGASSGDSGVFGQITTGTGQYRVESNGVGSSHSYYWQVIEFY